jgi:transposase
MIERDSDIDYLKQLLKSLHGTKVITIEESTASQLLWIELRMYVDEIIICDPYHNFLLSSGPKNDRIDAVKLLELLRAGLLKPVYHSAEEFMSCRVLLSGYLDLVKTGSAWKNRLKAQARARGGRPAENEYECFCEAVAEHFISDYCEIKKAYEELFKKIVQSSRVLRSLLRIPGIGTLSAFKTATVVVDANRFRDKGHFWAYCGLVKHRKMSGGRNYGSRSPRYSRILKSVFRTAAMACTHKHSKSSMKDYYDYLLSQGKPVHVARNIISRKIAAIALSVMKTGKWYRSDEIYKYFGGEKVTGKSGN